MSQEQEIAVDCQEEPQSLPKQDDPNSDVQIPDQNTPAIEQTPVTDETNAQDQEAQKTEIEEEDKDLKDLNIQDVLKVNSVHVDFGEVLPGQIIEETIIILNNMNKTKVPFKVKVNCLSEEFEELDEYVYSMRRPTPNEVFNYNDTFLIILAQKAISYYKLAIKVPNMGEAKSIPGSIEISSEKTQDSIITVPITAKIVLPKIKVEKMMRIKSLNMSVIKLFMKTPIRQDFRIALKNCGSSPVFVEFSILKNDRLVDYLDFTFYPVQISLQPLVLNNFVMSVKTKHTDQDIINKDIHVVLVVKVRNSSVIFSYPVLLTIGDGKSG